MDVMYFDAIIYTPSQTNKPKPQFHPSKEDNKLQKWNV